MKELRFAVFGAGFWAPFQLEGWEEVGGAKCVAVYNRTRSKAERLAERFGIPSVYDDAQALLSEEKVDFVDIITDVNSHSPFVRLAAQHKLPVICQKPLGPSLEEAREMASACRDASVPLFVHENFRWQTPIRALHQTIGSGTIGNVFRGRIQYANSFPVFDNQPFLKELDRFILTDMGTHILDVARFLFGEARSVYCRTHRVNPTIKGEDVATVLLATVGGATVTCELSYASRTEDERFPQTYAFVEGDRGSAVLGLDYWVRTTTAEGTHARRYPPPRYAWADPQYDVVHASIVDCNRNLLGALRDGKIADTTAADNLQTLELVYAAYESAEANRVVEVGA